MSVGGGYTLTIGGLLQTDAYLGRETADGFEVRSTRLRFGGEAESLQYAVQLDFASGSPLLDAFARLPLSKQLRVTAGIFKTPFRAEILTPRPDLLFAERARVVTNVAPNRQAGVALSSTPVPDRLTTTVGAFNGTSADSPAIIRHTCPLQTLPAAAFAAGGRLLLNRISYYESDRGLGRCSESFPPW